ncbi:hypothetical protein HMI56_001828 [Coelomomyces lativittatus]|nr:hypothetical protein HMI56_001828 [Coelomomyces lativittatus]
MDLPGGSNLFNDYEHDFNTLTTSLTTKLNELNASTSNQNDTWKSKVRAAERELEEAEEILSQMDHELYGLPPTTRTQLQPKFRNAKTQVDQLRKDFVRLKFGHLCFSSTSFKHK